MLLPSKALLLLGSAAAATCVLVAAQAVPRAVPESPLQQHLAAARAAQAHADCGTAAQEYQAAVRLLPNSGELRTNQGIALFCDRQLAPAVAAFTRALALAPALTVPHLFLGLAEYRLGNTTAAARELTTYLGGTPDDPVAHLWLGYTLAAKDDPLAARAQYQQVLQIDPRNLDAAYALGQADLALAHRNARAIAALDPGGAHLLQLAAARYRASGDPARAQAAEDQAARLRLAAPPVPPALARQLAALDADTAAQQTEATAAFASILDHAPDSFRAHQVLGDALVTAQQQPAAIPEYEAVLRLNPDLPGVHETLSQCLMTAGRFADALTALRAELALSPTLAPRLNTRIGQVKLAMGDTAGAATSLEQAVAGHDTATPPEAYLLLAEVRLRQQRAADAVPLLQHVLAADPDNTTALYYLSRAYRSTGDHAAMTQALADYQRVSQLARDHALADPVTRDTGAGSFAALTPTPDLAANPK